MATTIRYYDEEATIRDGVWESEDKAIQDTLNVLNLGLGPTGSTPDYDYFYAQEAVKAIKKAGGNARIVSFDPPKPAIENVVY